MIYKNNEIKQMIAMLGADKGNETAVLAADMMDDM